METYCWVCGDEKSDMKKIEEDEFCLRVIEGEQICADCCLVCDIYEACENDCRAKK